MTANSKRPHSRGTKAFLDWLAIPIAALLFATPASAQRDGTRKLTAEQLKTMQQRHPGLAT